MFTYAATEYSQARKCTHKVTMKPDQTLHPGLFSITQLDQWGVKLYTVHNSIYITELLGSVSTVL
jgi:hypothetical protein